MRGAGTWTGLLTLALLAGNTAAEASNQGDLNVLLKGGVGDYTGALGTFSSTGPSWGATLNFQPYLFLGVELGYEGSRHAVDDNRFAEGERPSLRPRWRRPHQALPALPRGRPALRGRGPRRLAGERLGNANGLYESDFMEEVPIAAGLEFNAGAFTAGVRATYRLLLNEDFADAAPGRGRPGGGLFDAALTVGGRFWPPLPLPNEAGPPPARG